MKRRRILGPAIEPLESRRLLAAMAFTVKNANDAGPDSLRQAVLDANANAGYADTIRFDIPGPGVHTIALLSPLPAITDPVTIDATAKHTPAGQPLVELSGDALSSLAPGIEIAASDVTVAGLAISGFGGAGVQVDPSAARATIRSNFIGTDATGTTDAGNFDGVAVLGGPNATVSQNVIAGNDGSGVLLDHAAGATVASNRIGTDYTGAHPLPNEGDGITADTADTFTLSANLLAANGGSGISLSAATNGTLTANLIGTDATGLLSVDASGNPFGNGGDGITVGDASANNTVGGTTPAARNVISNNGGSGVYIGTGTTSAANTVQGNYIGTDATGAAPLPNQANGVTLDSPGTLLLNNLISGNAANGISLDSGARIQGNLIGTTAAGNVPLPNQLDGLFITGSNNTIGGTAAGDANTIAFNLLEGITILFGNQNAVRRNAIYANADLGLDLGADGVTPNDSAGHADANLRQNFPVLASAQQSSAGVTVQGTLTAAPSTTYAVELFGNASPDPTGYGEGQSYLGTATVTTDPAGKATFSLLVTVPAGQSYVSATATDPAGNTSEFSQDIQITVAPPPVVLIPTTTTLASSLNPSHFGQDHHHHHHHSIPFHSIPFHSIPFHSIPFHSIPFHSIPFHSVTFTAHVTASNGGTPTGTVTFKEGSLVLGTATLDALANARISTSSLSVGDHTIIAYYGGNAPYLPSNSPPLVQHVLISPATASGRTLSDRTGNGLTTDDTPLPGVTVSAFLDRNNNGALDAADGAPVATAASNSAGAYAFNSLSPFIRYFIQETVPTGYVRTAPALSSYYTVTTGDGTSSPNNDFDNYKTCDCSNWVKNIQYTINGSRTSYSTLADRVHEGDTVKVSFTVPTGKKATLSLVSYAAPDAYFDAAHAARQKIYKSASGTFSAGSHTLTVTAPRSFFQVDFVCGLPIDHFGPASSNVFYTPQNRLISADNGGTHTPATSMLYSSSSDTQTRALRRRHARS